MQKAGIKAICTVGWSTAHRHVSDSTRRKVFVEYGITIKTEYGTLGSYEVDHLIPLELGGSNELANLWPEPWPGNTVKDVSENALHRAVCAKKISLKNARDQMRVYAK